MTMCSLRKITPEGRGVNLESGQVGMGAWRIGGRGSCGLDILYESRINKNNKKIKLASVLQHNSNRIFTHSVCTESHESLLPTHLADIWGLRLLKAERLFPFCLETSLGVYTSRRCPKGTCSSTNFMSLKPIPIAQFYYLTDKCKNHSTY